jgi:hypothetical protein
MRTETGSMSVPTAIGVPVFAAAMASTPVPQPTSSTRSNARSFSRRS